MTRLVWYRNDLRVNFHRPLQAAMATDEPVRALYLLTSDQWRQHDVAPIRQWYVLASLLELGDSLAELGVELDVIDCGDFASVPEMLKRYVTQTGITDIHCCREYPLNELRRDRAAVAALEIDGVRFHGIDDAVLVPPKALKTGQGGWYTVFSPYRRSWEKWLSEQGVHNEQAVRQRQPVSFPGRSVVEAALSALNVPESLRQYWQPGEKAAREQLSRFIANGLCRYDDQRDLPAEPGTSSLSAALSAGTLSVAECFLAADRCRQQSDCKGAHTWIGELAWRDFYRQIMANFPSLSWGEPFRKETGWVQWRRDESDFHAWCEGRTGYPLVDAGMRQLLECGWMHNRVRMVVAMFLTKNLFIDWRWGERWFMTHLIDGDFAANNGGWQWSASTGTDAAPYFRVFNPVRQSQRFDNVGNYIRRFVPELAALDDKLIHEPWRQPLLAPDYPSPIVELKGVRERVTDAFQAAKEFALQEQH